MLKDINIMNKIYTEENAFILKKYIINCFAKKKSWYRKELISSCVKEFNLTID